MMVLWTLFPRRFCVSYSRLWSAILPAGQQAFKIGRDRIATADAPSIADQTARRIAW